MLALAGAGCRAGRVRNITGINCLRFEDAPAGEALAAGRLTTAYHLAATAFAWCATWGQWAVTRGRQLAASVLPR